MGHSGIWWTEWVVIVVIVGLCVCAMALLIGAALARGAKDQEAADGVDTVAVPAPDGGRGADVAPGPLRGRLLGLRLGESRDRDHGDDSLRRTLDNRQN